MRDKEAMDQSEKKRRLDIVVKGADSEYWKILSEKVQEMILIEERYQDRFRKTGVSAFNASDYNRSIDQVYFLRRFLNVNDVLISDYKGFLEKAKDFVNEIWDRSHSFVGRVGKE